MPDTESSTVSHKEEDIYSEEIYIDHFSFQYTDLNLHIFTLLTQPSVEITMFHSESPHKTLCLDLETLVLKV